MPPLAGGAGALTPGGGSDVGTIDPVRVEAASTAGPAGSGGGQEGSPPGRDAAGTEPAPSRTGASRRVPEIARRPAGLMQIPDDGSRVGWYRHGPAAGAAVGSVVLAGHVDTDEGLGVMAALREVPLESRVEVELADGSVLAYEVVGRRTVPADDLPLDELFDRDGPARLTLITCGGPWRPEAASHRDNVVVVALPLVQG